MGPTQWIAIAGLAVALLGQFALSIWWASRLASRVESLERQVGNDIAGRRAFMAVRDDVNGLKQSTADMRTDIGGVVINLAELRKDMFGLMIRSSHGRNMNEGDL